MTNLNKSPFFLRKVRNQVLKNQKINYVLKHNIFEIMEPSNYTFVNTLYNKCPIDGTDVWDLQFEGPRDYPWKNDTKIYLLYHRCCIRFKIIFVLPLDWLRQCDPTAPIFRLGYYYDTCYLDFKNQKCFSSDIYIIRDNKYYLYKYIDKYSKKPRLTHPIRKSDEDWCVTYLNVDHIYLWSLTRSMFYSSLLCKNLDFSVFDAIVKAGYLNCPVRSYEHIKVKTNPQIKLKCFDANVSSSYLCICVDCRKDYRAITVQTFSSEGYHLELIPKNMITETNRYFSGKSNTFKMTFYP